MNIAVIGLTYTHPYSYTRILQRMGHRVSHVWDHVPGRVVQFAEHSRTRRLAGRSGTGRRSHQ